LFEQGLDKLKQMVDLFQFAPAVLVELALSRQDVQRFE
jgi:hypothetical protein